MASTVVPCGILYDPARYCERMLASETDQFGCEHEVVIVEQATAALFRAVRFASCETHSF